MLACKRVITTENGKTKEGNEYRIFRQGDNTHKIAEGDIIDFHLIIKDTKDSVLQSTYAQPGGKPIENYKFSEKEAKKDILALFKMLTVGDSAVFRIKTEIEVEENKENLRKTIAQMEKNFASMPDSIQKKNAIAFESQLKQAKDELIKPNPLMPAGKFISYYVKIFRVENEEQKKKREGEENTGRDKKEKDDLAAYCKKNNLTPKTTKSGLMYVITKEGKGEMPKVGDMVSVNYAGRNITGKVFDTSIEAIAKEAKLMQQGRKYEPLKFPIGQRQVIPGWDEGIMLLNKGAKATLIIPNRLAYGQQSPSPDIPAGAPLFFEVELVDFTSAEADRKPEGEKVKEKKEEKK